MQTTTRPSTSKSRGQCRYHTSSPRGCLAGDSCKFLHGDETISPYDRAKACKFYAAGYCKRGEDCWFRHIPPDTKSLPTAELPPPASGDPCGICLEVPVTFGLLSDCGHAFCLDCIRNWREQKTKNDDYAESRMNKRCPYCRTLSGYVFPSSHFYPHGHPGKDAALRRYKESAARVPCKYFNESPPEDRYCPFGHDCHYQHLDADGTPYIFPRGVSHYMSQLNLRRRPQDRAAPITIPQAPVDFTHRDDLRNFFNDVRHILDSIRPTATAPEPAPGGDLPPTAAEHLLDILNATELAVAELWATESSRAPSPEPANPPPPLVPSLGPASEDEELDDASTVPLLANAGGLGIDSDSDIESDFPSVSTLLARLPPRSTLHEATFPSAATTSANIPPTQQSLNTPLVAPEPPLPTTEATATLSSDAGIPAIVPISPQDQAGVDVPAGVEERPTAHAEPPFMTDGRGRVVWSRSGAKEGVPSAEGQPSASS